MTSTDINGLLQSTCGNVKTHPLLAINRLAEGFTDLQIQVKDLYKKQESEKVVVDIDGDTAGKDKDGDVDRNMEITVTKEDHTNKSGFSDISDASDGESKLSEKKASVPVVTADDSNHNKPAIALPSFDAVKSPQPEFRRDGAKNSTKEGVWICIVNNSLPSICRCSTVAGGTTQANCQQQAALHSVLALYWR